MIFDEGGVVSRPQAAFYSILGAFRPKNLSPVPGFPWNAEPDKIEIFAS
ncbi:MAG: hypothetical protein QM811_04730 [Pirellulales bacterium]